MGSDNVLHNIEEVNTIIKERLNAKIAAEDMVKLRLDSQVKYTQEKINSLEQKYSLKSDRWTKIQLEELQDNISFLTERVDVLKSLTSKETKNSQQKVNAMIKRTQSRLINENRLGKQKLGAARNLSLDEEDETFILRCIENKATAHGRRHDVVMYLHHRIKKADLLELANFNRISRDLPTIRSSVTVYNRSRPKDIRSRQAKNHLGKGLFCTKKPPKAETMQNESTHYQRATGKIYSFGCLEKKIQMVMSIPLR